jgi:hypothetical protein
VLEGSVECHTCLLDVCPHDNLCMKQITVDEVLAAAEDILRTTRTGRADERTFEAATMPVQS